MQTNKLTKNKIENISNNLLRIRTSLILSKRKLQKTENQIERYLAENEYNMYAETISDVEMEFSMVKFIWFNLKKEN